MPINPPPAPLRPHIEVIGGNCLTLVASGSGAPLDPYIISGDLRLGSVIRCTANGLDVRLSSDASNMLKYGNDGGLYGSMPYFADDSVRCNSGSCIDITVSGNGTDCNPFIVSGDLRIDPTCDLVTCGPNGLCVSPTKLDALNTSCIKLELTGDGSNLHPYQLSAYPLINPAGSGLLSCGPNGLNVAPTFILAKDTNTVDHLLVGTGTSYDPYELSSRVKIDPRISNLLHESSSGLFVECSEIAGCVGLEVIDTNTLDLTKSGSGTLSNPWSIFGNVKIDPSGTNILSATANGLLVNGANLAGNLDFNVSDTSTVNHTINGTGSNLDPWHLTSSVKVDPALGNLIQVVSGGLRVDCSSIAGCIDINAVDTSTIDTTVSNPSTGTWNVSSVAKISTTAGNTLTSNATGLYVPTLTASDTTTVSDTSSINMTLSGDNISSVAIISPDARNGLSIRANGLYADICESAISTNGNGFVDTTVGPFASAGVYTLGSTGAATITCPSDHCGVRILRNFGVSFDAPLNPNVRALIWIDFNINGSGFSPYIFMASDINPSIRVFPLGTNATENHGTLNPGSTTTIDVRLRLELIGGGMWGAGSLVAGINLIPVGV